MKYATFIGTSVLALALSGAALAATPPSADSVSFTSLDANHDGRLSSAETDSQAQLKASFDKLDSDHDGYLSPAEFSKWPSAKRDNSGGDMSSDSGKPADSNSGTPAGQ